MKCSAALYRQHGQPCGLSIGTSIVIVKGGVMQNQDVAFSGSIAELYDRCLVPLIFQDYANDLASRVAALEPKAVLETAAGTGAVTRALAARLPGDTRLVATDLNKPMLDHAARTLAADTRISW